MAIVRVIMITIWVLAGFYFGIAGWMACKVLQNSLEPLASSTDKTAVIYEGISFRDRESFQEFVREKTYAKWCPLIFQAPDEIWPLIASLAWGLAGGAAQLIKRMTMDTRPVTFLELFSGPLFGALVGSMLFWLSFLVPKMLIVSQDEIRPEALAGLSFLGGVFSNTTYVWVESKYRDLLPKE